MLGQLFSIYLIIKAVHNVTIKNQGSQHGVNHFHTLARRSRPRGGHGTMALPNGSFSYSKYLYEKLLSEIQ